MRKLDFFLLKAFLFSGSIVAALAVFSWFYDLESNAYVGGYFKILYDFFGFVFAFWMLITLYLSVRLIMSNSFREMVLTRMTFIRERDEREVLLTGMAAKRTMLTSIALLLFLFCLSSFEFSVYHVPPEKAIDGETKVASWGLSFGLLANSPPEQGETAGVDQKIVTYTGLPVSNASLLLGLIIWQIVIYNYSMRRLL